MNKIGHALHALEPAFREFTLENQDLQNLAKELAFHEDPRGTLRVSWEATGS